MERLGCVSCFVYTLEGCGKRDAVEVCVGCMHVVLFLCGECKKGGDQDLIAQCSALFRTECLGPLIS